MSKASQDYYNRKLANHYTDYPVRRPCGLMEFLMTCVPGTTRSRAKQLLGKKMVFVDKVITTQFDTPLQPGQLVQIAARGNAHELRSRFVRILYEDAFLLVVEKAEGILTNVAPGVRDNSVKKILDAYVKLRSRTLSVHTVHRLDRATSGLLVFAKRRDVQQMFTDNWYDIVSDRRYAAVVEGLMERDEGTVSSWLTDNRMFVSYSTPYDNGGKYAVTHYRTLERSGGRSLVELKLDTGRKNQIRVHMQELGHPVVGDVKYGSEEDPIGRVCLHAFRLAFTHPITGEHLQFETPVPPKFLSLVRQ